MARMAIKMFQGLIPLILLFSSIPSPASWELSSEFKLQLSNGLFNGMIEDFWSSLQGGQTIPINDIYLQTPIPIAITGIHTKLQYSFPKPTQINNSREWELASNNVSADLYVSSINASQIIERDIGGIIVRIRLDAECHNIHLKLPQNLTSVRARIRADVNQAQVKISMPAFEANWIENSWQLISMQCTGAEGFDQIVKTEALKVLQTIHNFDEAIHSELTKQLDVWSKKSSLVLLSEQNIPTNREDLQIRFEPRDAYDSGDDDLEISGTMRFHYPYISKGENITHSFALTQKEVDIINKTPNKNSRLLLPFQTIRGLIMGNYLSGKMEFSMRSFEIPAFQELMQSRWKQFFAWPDLMHFSKNTTFLFQFVPMGPPALDNPKTGAKGELVGNLNLPLSLRMYAPQKNKYIPYVEFKTNLSGIAHLQLLNDGKVQFQLDTSALNINYNWSKSYLQQYDVYERIAVKTIGSALKGSLQTQGLELNIPTLPIGLTSKLVPTGWSLQGETASLEFISKANK